MNEVSGNNINERWHLILWDIFAIISGVIVSIELLLPFFRHSYIKSLDNSFRYVFFMTILPIVVEGILLIVARALIKSDRISLAKKRWIVSIMMFTILAVPAFLHCELTAIVMLPGAAIVAGAIFANNDTTVVMTILNVASIIIDYVFLGITKGWNPTLLGNMFMSMVVAIGLCALVIVLNNHTNELIDSINESNIIQRSLSVEMKKDPMTGLYNRRSFEETLENEIESAEQTGNNSFIAIFDIDHFKNVNDTYGHANGDVVIKSLCKIMQKKSQDSGIAFRYGGEEFVILFSNIELPKVINIVEDIRTEFRCYYFQFMLKDGITCSCGIAQHQQGESSKAWFNRADASLYKAKEAGRNRTVISE